MSRPHRGLLRLLGSLVGRFAIIILIFIGAAWSFGAVWYDAPFGRGNPVVAAVVAVLFVSLFFLVRPGVRRIAACAILFGGILAWWLTIKPDENRPWLPDVANRAWADIADDQITVHNVRNCEYRTETDYTPHWETRVFHLSQITGADISITYWGSPWIAHPIVSFEFADALPLAFSIETRKSVGQSYSTIAGFYRQYGLICIPADERDLLGLRTNYRHEQVYLYEVNVSRDHARKMFFQYLADLNHLRQHPRFYNAVTDNCTTNIRSARVAAEHGNVPSWDWRILLNGKMDELLYQRDLITHALPFPELKARSLINQRALAAGNSPNYSDIIREGLPPPLAVP